MSEAARHLSTFLAEEAKEADILRLGLDGHLKLSVYLSNGSAAKRCLSTVEELSGTQACRLAEALKTKDEICFIKGIYDLPLIGAERDLVDREWQRLSNYSVEEVIYIVGSLVQEENGQLYLLQEYYPSEPKLDVANAEINSFGNYGLSNGLPRGSILVVRTSALYDLEESLIEQPKKEKPRSQREEVTYYRCPASNNHGQKDVPKRRGPAPTYREGI